MTTDDLISIHSPHTRGDSSRPEPSQCTIKFQSTPLTRGETITFCISPPCSIYFNPLPSHEGRLGLSIIFSRFSDFNPLPSHEGRPYVPAIKSAYWRYFNPLPSHEGRPDRKIFPVSPEISIHSPHTRGDLSARTLRGYRDDFNPLPSHEGRRDDFFQTKTRRISIHSPHTRGDGRVWRPRGRKT